MPTTEPGPGQRSDSIMDKNTPINSDGMQKDLKPGAISIIKQYAIEILGVMIFIIGIILLIVYNKETITTESTSNCKKFVYTNCISVADETFTCAETLKDEPLCTCYLDVNITQELKGNVTVYYELTSFDQKNQSYSSSRDNDQLSGELSPTPSSNCGDYTYDENKKPIVPCGLVAYTMFTDDFELSAKRKPLLRVFTGLIEKDSSVYRNPPNGSIYANFSEEFKKTFVKPKTWKNNIWELDPTNPENNGFQNEAFIAWMNTDLSRKPAWRLNQTSDDLAQGLPAGIYKLRIEYSYPPKLYDGERIVWICGTSYTHQVSRNVGVVIFLIIVTIIGLIIALCRPVRRLFPQLIRKIRKQ